MDCRVLWTERALQDLNGVLASIAEGDPLAAERLGTRMLNQVRMLELQPEMGKFVKPHPRGEYRRLVQGNYLIYYKHLPDNQRVEIAHIWHGARRPPLI